jgi:uncharacterized protein involved in outer membrane biogenesis
MLRRLLVAVIALVLLVAGSAYAWLSSDQVRLTLEKQASAAIGLPVRIGSARAMLFPRAGLTLSDVRVGAPAFLTLSRVSVSSELLPLLSRRVEGAEIRIADTLLALPLPAALPLPGTGASRSAAASGSVGAPVSLISVHTIALDRVKVRSLGRTVEISATAGLEGDRLALSAFTASAGRTSLSASGTVTLGDAVAATLDATATQLDLDDLLALVHAFGLDGASSPGRKGPVGSLALRLSTPVVRVAGLEASKLTAYLRTTGSQLVIDPLSLTMFDGAVKGSMRLTVGTRIAGQVRVAVTRLDAAQLAAWGDAEDTLSGRLSGSGSFAGAGADLATLLGTANGSGQVEIIDGALPGLEFPREALVALGRPSDQAPPPNGGRFDRIAAPFTVGDGRLTSAALSLSSRDVSVAASGSLDLATEVLDVKGTATLSAALTAMAGPALTRVAGGGSQIVLPATVTGTLDAPSIRLDAGSLIRQGLRSEATGMKERLKDRVMEKLAPMRGPTRPKSTGTF